MLLSKIKISRNHRSAEDEVKKLWWNSFWPLRFFGLDGPQNTYTAARTAAVAPPISVQWLLNIFYLLTTTH